jgi:hypothetical protein
VVEFCDYLTGETFLSFIGDTEVAKTALYLLENASADDELSDELRLIPEITSTALQHDSGLAIAPQPDEYDYIFTPPRDVGLSGGTYEWIRRELRRFERSSAGPGGIAIIDSDPELLGHQSDIFMNIFDRWSDGSTDGVAYASSERRAIDRLCQSISMLLEHTKLSLHVALQSGDIFGFSVIEVLPDNTAIAHFVKSDGRLAGLSTRFFVEHLRFADVRGIPSINWEQDLGIPGLRQHKRHLNPSGYLNKYAVSLSSGILP